jgi:plastocyanin
MRRCLSIALATAGLLNLWALPGGPLAEEPPAMPQQPPTPVAPQQPPAPEPQPAPPEGGRARAATSAGDTPQRKAHRRREQPVKAAAAGSVTIKDFSFGPSSISVHVGDTVTWVNNGPTDHTATAGNGSFDTGTLKKGQSASHTFTSAGTVSYICSIHPFMKGTVVVAAAGGGGSGGSSAGAGSPGSGNGNPTPAAPAQSSGGLPNTGVDVGLVLLSSALLIASGLVLRRTARG